MHSQSLEILKAQPDTALSNVLRWPCFEQHLVTSKGPFQPEHSWGSDCAGYWSVLWQEEQQAVSTNFATERARSVARITLTSWSESEFLLKALPM